MDKIKTEYIDINLLKPSEYNPRKASEKEWKDLESSLKEFGFVDPVLVNKHPGRENVIIGGHFRIRVAKELGIKEVPVVYLDLPIEKEKELNLRLNKNQGEWDWELLANFDEKLLMAVGFDADDLAFLTDKALISTPDGDQVIDTRVEVPEVRVVINCSLEKLNQELREFLESKFSPEEINIEVS